MTKFQVPVFTVLFFISATLIFSVQPMLGKMMLPYVGGSPAGWIVAMAFFQAALLAGYGLAHLCSKLNPFTQGLVTVLFLLLGLYFVPVNFDGQGLTDLSAIMPGVVFIKLAMVVSIPFIALSSITPAFQRIFSAGQHETAKDPYYFYAASNLGSFFGLLSYPFIIEPFFPLEVQADMWMWLYFILIGLCVISCALVFGEKRKLVKIGLGQNHIPRQSPEDEGVSSPGWNDYIRWMCLAAIPSSLILGVTTYITANLSSVPLIWIIPLGLYLLSHVMAFAKKRYVQDDLGTNLFHAALIVIGVVFYLSPVHFIQGTIGFIFLSLFFLFAFFVTALLLHTKLANDRPAARHLTIFYFMLSLGGALGGSFNAFIAPLIFDNTYEFPLVLLASLLFNSLLKRKAEGRLGYIAIGLAALLGYGIASYLKINWDALIQLYDSGLVSASIQLLTALFFISMFMTIMNIRLAVTVSATALALHIFHFVPAEYEIIHRNFFGISKIYKTTEFVDKDAEEEVDVRVYVHGDTLHGLQALDEPYKTTPFSYYPGNSPVGYTFHVSRAKDIGVIGLGAGVMACYSKYFPDISLSFFEIDPFVKEVAETEFSFLDQCGYEKLWLGDGRLLIEALPLEQKYDLLMMDAFTSDAIPLHIMTRDALEIYLDKLSEDGILIFNVSNRYLDLTKPLAALARSLNKSAYFFYYISKRSNTLTYDSQWVVLLNSDRYKKDFERMGWEDISEKYTDFSVWTDNYSNIVTAFTLPTKERVREQYEKWRPLSEELRSYMDSRLGRKILNTE